MMIIYNKYNDEMMMICVVVVSRGVYMMMLYQIPTMMPISLLSPASDEHRILHSEKRQKRAGIWWGNAVHGQVKIAASGRLPCP